MLKEVIGTNISSLRGERGWTKWELSQAVGISSRYLRSIERGEANITVKILERVAEVFGVSPVELVTLKRRHGVSGTRRGRRETTEERIIRFLRRRKGEATIVAPKMAKKIGRSERAVWKSLKSLRTSGEVVVIERGGGRGKGNTYRLSSTYEPDND